jgi:hypothetical protein
MLAIALLTASPAWADDQAEQTVGLFMQSCVQFAGHADALRGWAKSQGLMQLPEPVRQQFMQSAPGVAFDASDPAGKFVLISDDRGGCSVIAQRANGPAVLASLENDMRRAGISLKLSHDAPDAQEAKLQVRDYTASLGGSTWRIVVGTVRDQQGGQAMLSAVHD